MPFKKLHEKKRTQGDSRIYNFSGRKCQKMVRNISERKRIAVVYIEVFIRLCGKAK